MVIEALEDDVIVQLRSSFTIDSVTQCVTELVLNSLDSKSSAIAVRVNLTTFQVQVVDNGKGISRSNLESVGRRYMTNKCHSISDLRKRIKYYGFKGETLASIIKISKRVIITTKEQSNDETYCKIIEGDESKIELVKTRPSSGTTVTIEGFLSNLPVRQLCIKSNELENIKKGLERLIIIHPRVCFSLRNDLTGKIILDSRKCGDIASSFKNIHPDVDENGFVLFKVSKGKTSVEGLIHRNFHENKRLQYIYVNKRSINCPKIQNLMNFLFKNAHFDLKKKHPIFIIHIKCPYSEIDLILEPSKTVIFFKKFDIVKRCIEKMVNKFLGKETKQSNQKKSVKGKSEFGVSQIGGAVKGLGVKRKSDESEGAVLTKSPKIIEDTPFLEESPKRIVKQTKMALPIEIKRSEKKEMNECEANFDKIKDNSLFTNFPDNERKGKDIIMDLFMMSVQAFPTENKSLESSPDAPANSVLGDFKVTPFKLTEYDTMGAQISPFKSSNKVTMGIQTTLKESPVKEKMVSVGIQAGSSDVINDVTFVPPRKSLKKYVSDYNFDFSKVETFPIFNFNRKLSPELPSFINFDQTRKLFDFNHDDGNYPDLNDTNRNDTTTSFQSLKLSPIAKMTVEKPKKKIICNKIEMQCRQSPYFVKKTSKNIISLKKADSSSKVNDEIDDKKEWKMFVDKKMEITFDKRNKCRNFNETVSRYFTPIKKNFSRNSSKRNIIRELTPNNLEQSEDLFLQTKSSEEEKQINEVVNNILITLDENEKQKIVNKDLQCGKHLTCSNKWRKEVDAFGSNIKIDKKTGVLHSPKKDVTFELVERFDFVPKGLSPILKDFGKVDSLSPESKENFQNAILQSYEDELLLIKWQKCIDNKEPRKFFEEIYLEKSKLIESEIPNVAKNAYPKDAISIFEQMTFTKEMFGHLDVVGQIDCKFIAALDKSKKLILLFDQHAVHERVRLEELSEGYKNASIKIENRITIFLPQNELLLIRNQKTNLHSLGLVLDFFTNGINISQVPLCIYNKHKKGANLVDLIEILIKEIIESLKTTNGILVNTPRTIQNIVNSEACRGAIKFGDALTKTECFMHLKQLAECALPFQCAHGRPTLTPLISLKTFDNSAKFISKPNLNVLK